MTNRIYIYRSLRFYRRQHLALFLGIAVSAAVLTGALTAGDSIRYSLTRIVETRLGKSQTAIVSGTRFMDKELAGRLSASLRIPVTPLLMLNGIAINQESGIRVNKATIIGIDSSFALFSSSPVIIPVNGEAVIGKRLADRLGLKEGDDLLVRTESAGLIPVNSPFARESDPSIAVRLRIAGIATDEQLGMFSLNNDQTAPMNVFVSISFLGERLELDGLANTFLLTDEGSGFSSGQVQDSVQANWSLTDIGGIIKEYPGKGTYDLTSNRIFIDTVVSNVVKKSALAHDEIVTYLVNDISLGGRHTPYSFASAVPASISGIELEGDEVIINQWTADDLRAAKGDSLSISYYTIGPLRQLVEKSRRFIVKGIIDNTTESIDRTLMPDFQGFSEAGNCSDWNAGVPVDLERIRDKDEDYWDDYRGTPKVILSPETGRVIWENQFGSLTALRFNTSEVSPDHLSQVLLNNLKPSDLGIMVINLREEGAEAAMNSVNFKGLFLGLSFFVIASGILLTVLIYSLHFNRRSNESALLSSLGFSTGKILRLRLTEASIVIIAGSIGGVLLSLLYNNGILAALNTIWNDMVRTDVLTAKISIMSLITGSLASIVLALIPIVSLTGRMLRKPLALQMKGYSPSGSSITGTKRFSFQGGLILIILSLLIVLFSVFAGKVENALSYLTSSGLFISGAMLLFAGFLRRRTIATAVHRPTVLQLAYKNLCRNPARSLAVIALLATGTFAIVLTGSYRKTYFGADNIRESGTGGYQLWAETTGTVPVDLNSGSGREKLVVNDQSELDGVSFLQFQSLDGDDASCLNLNQVQRPRLLAVNSYVLDSVKAFTFTGMLSFVSVDSPWTSLDMELGQNTYPAYADRNVIRYSLQKNLGDTLIYLDEAGNTFRLVLAAAIDNSVFQGNILISGNIFRRHFPSSGGSRVILAETPPDRQQRVSEIMSRSLVDYGIEITTTSDRLAVFNSVENTYLSVFMALSGLGFIIGTIGLGIVLLRNIYERRRELALLLSLGYSRKLIFRIVFAENLMLLAGGLLTGLVSAIVGIFPSLLSPAFDIQWAFLTGIIVCIILSGLCWIYFPLRSALKRPLIPALRSE